jgi:hypothetical protein
VGNHGEITLYIVSVTTLLNHASALAQKELVDYVDPLIGTSTSIWMLCLGPSMPPNGGLLCVLGVADLRDDPWLF